MVRAHSTHSEASVKERLAALQTRFCAYLVKICPTARSITGNILWDIPFLAAVKVLTIALYILIARNAFCITFPRFCSLPDCCYGSANISTNKVDFILLINLEVQRRDSIGAYV